MKYKVLGQINHSDGISYPGDIVEFSSADAGPLLEVKAIEPYHQPFSKVPSNGNGQGDGNV